MPIMLSYTQVLVLKGPIKSLRLSWPLEIVIWLIFYPNIGDGHKNPNKMSGILVTDIKTWQRECISRR